ncbi:branched-chain amino acid ABC transporter permease [Pseudoxanthobacter sp. M-2]|uniref:branched-chain amino acid ABC transporter permease n=1 Tax=Pseudoxanthobacter sp. M-2 TaxID=3078754 RepID=UPI0038FC163F
MLFAALDGLNYVLVIALVAMGLVVVFGLMNVINMAHGELFLLGAYTLSITEMLGGSFWLGIVLAPLILALVGLAIEELVVRHVYHRFLDTILATWGLSIAIKQAVVLAFGPQSRTASPPFDFAVEIFGAPYPAYRLFVMAVSVAVIAGTFLLFFRTRFGLTARAVIANRRMASCLGIDTRRLDRLTFAFGAALAGLAGAVMAPLMSVDPQMGLGFLVPAFLAILVGGTGHLAGVLAGSVLVGGTDTVIARLWSPVVAQIVVFTLAIIVIRLFPRGIVGGRERR